MPDNKPKNAKAIQSILLSSLLLRKKYIQINNIIRLPQRSQIGHYFMKLDGFVE